MQAYEREPGVAWLNVAPVQSRGGMAHGAILRESASLVRRVVGAVVIGLVAAPAGAAGQAVVVVHVALRALQRGMRTGQSEAGGSVIERGALSSSRVVWHPEQSCGKLAALCGGLLVPL